MFDENVLFVEWNIHIEVVLNVWRRLRVVSSVVVFLIKDHFLKTNSGYDMVDHLGLDVNEEIFTKRREVEVEVYIDIVSPVAVRNSVFPSIYIIFTKIFPHKVCLKFVIIFLTLTNLDTSLQKSSREGITSFHGPQVHMS